MTQILFPFMDLETVDRSLKFYKKRKKWVIWLALAGISGYGAYKAYNLPAVSRKRRKLMMLIGSLVSMAEAASDSAEAIRVVSKDVKEFLICDSDEIPNSLRQVSKIAKSDEFSVAFGRVTEALTVGMLRGYKGKQAGSTAAVGVDFTDRVVDKLCTPAGTGFVSAVVGSLAKNLVLGFYGGCSPVRGGSENGGTMPSRDGFDSSNERWVSLACNDKSRELIADCIPKLVGTAVVVYLDKTMNINFYDELFTGLTNPKHEVKIREMLVLLCNGAVETLVKTSHHVLRSSGSSSEPMGSNSPQKEGNLVPLCKFFKGKFISNRPEEGASSNWRQNREWFGQAMSTLAVPSNRKFVLDVTGRVTFETVRSFMAFILWKLSEIMKKGGNVIQEEVLIWAGQMVGFIGVKSFVILTICIAMCLHLYGYSSRALLPARGELPPSLELARSLH